MVHKVHSGASSLKTPKTHLAGAKKKKMMDPSSTSSSDGSKDPEQSSLLSALDEEGVRRNSNSSGPRIRRRRARPGDVVSLQLHLVPENGYVPETLFDANGIVTFVLGWGDYLPALHELIAGCAVGESIENVSIDAGYGGRQDDLIVRVSKDRLADYEWTVGETFQLKGMTVLVAEDLGDAVLLDANPPLAGASYRCDFTLLSIEDAPYCTPSDRSNNSDSDSHSSSRFELASFALGCFWGAELAFLRQPGVVGTRVGYSHGNTVSPTYDEVCEGRTQHRETVLVVYDPDVVTYAQLLQVALERLVVTAPTNSPTLGLTRLFGDEEVEESAGASTDTSESTHVGSSPSKSLSKQYQHGFYYHTEEQRQLLLTDRELRHHHHRFGIEVLRADVFYGAEEYHQKYLYKGGQSARKGCRDTIRCYG